MGDMVLANARLVLDREVVTGSVQVSDGRIIAVDQGPCALTGAEDLEGDHLMPGLVELHTDNLERHLAPRPAVEWPAMPALMAHDAQLAAAGITTVLDALRLGDLEDSDMRTEIVCETMKAIAHARDEGWLRADHLVHIRCELAADDLVPAFGQCLDTPLLRLVSVMDHTPGQRQFRDVEKWKIYLRGKYEMDETEIESAIGRRQELAARNAQRNRREIIALARGRVAAIASHDDTTLAHVEEAAEQGITISEFPTTLEAAVAARCHGMTTIAGAPNVVRGGSHSGNVSVVELVRGRHLDALSSDYVPISLLHSAILLGEMDGMTLPETVRMVTSNPARMVGLKDRGQIDVGKRADLVRVRSDAGPPRVRTVWCRGERVL